MDAVLETMSRGIREIEVLRSMSARPVWDCTLDRTAAKRPVPGAYHVDGSRAMGASAVAEWAGPRQHDIPLMRPFPARALPATVERGAEEVHAGVHA